MKKLIVILSMVIILFCLSGCGNISDKATTKKETLILPQIGIGFELPNAIKNGTYTFKQMETELELSANITISDNDISFSYDLLSSYLAYGSYTIKNEILTMTTYDDMYKSVFKIDNDSLFFQKKESSSVNLIDDQFGVKIEDNAEFKLIMVGCKDKDTSKVQPAVKAENADYDLCGENEEILLSFKMSNSDKYASICLSNDQPEYIIYRFGLRDDIELEYADKTKSSWDNFTYSYYLRGGGPENEGLDLNYLYFENGGYTYQIYEEYSSDNDDTSVGILVTDLETGEETDHKGDSDSIKGSLIGLRDNEKITINMQ